MTFYRTAFYVIAACVPLLGLVELAWRVRRARYARAQARKRVIDGPYR